MEDAVDMSPGASAGAAGPHALSIGRILRDTGLAFRRSGPPILLLAIACVWAPERYIGLGFSPGLSSFFAPPDYTSILLHRLAIVGLASLGQSAILTLALAALDGQPIRANVADVRWCVLRSIRAWPPLLALALVMSAARFALPLPQLIDGPLGLRPLMTLVYALQGLSLLLTLWIGVYPPAVVAERRSVWRGVLRADILLSGRRARFMLVLLLLATPQALPGALMILLQARRLLPPDLPWDEVNTGVKLLTVALGALWTVGLAATYVECRRQREGPAADELAVLFD